VPPRFFRPLRTGVVVACVALALLTTGCTATTVSTSAPHVLSPSPTPTALSLRGLAAPFGLRIGSAINADTLARSTAYRSIAAQQFSTVTPENEMKWSAVEPVQGKYTWSDADALVAFAQRNDQLVRGHTLVWYKQLPAWLTAEAATLTPDATRAILKKHIFDEVKHFKGKIWQWDVVNEAFDDKGNLRDNLWLQKLGPGYIADAFRWARAADPKALLFYNDYDLEFSGAKSNAVFALIKKLKGEGVPIDGVGFQTHLDTRFGVPGLRQNLQRFADLHLDVAETEVDVRTPLPVTSEAQAAQVAEYTDALQACVAVRRCVSFTVWGFDDGTSWVPTTFTGEGAADLYDANLQPKPQLHALLKVLQESSDARRRAD